MVAPGVAKVGFGMEVAKCIVLAARTEELCCRSYRRGRKAKQAAQSRKRVSSSSKKLTHSLTQSVSQSVSHRAIHWFIVIFVLIDSSVHRLIDSLVPWLIDSLINVPCR